MSTDATESTDDLSKPLGRRAKKKKQFVVPMWVVSRSIAGALGLCVAVLVGWILFVDEPFGDLGVPQNFLAGDGIDVSKSLDPGDQYVLTGFGAAVQDVAALVVPHPLGDRHEDGVFQ